MMGNQVPAEPASDTLARYRERAVRATDVAVVITDGTAPGSPIVWVNEAFTRTTGYPADEVIGRRPTILHGPGTDLAQSARLGQAVRDGVSTTVTVLNYRRDGSPFWNQVSVSPMPDDDGRLTHWVGIQVDVTEQVALAAAQELSITTERRARSGLVLVSQVSDLLSDLEDPYVLREISSLLRADLVRSAQFFLADARGLRPASSIDTPRGAAPSRRQVAEAAGAVRTVADPVQDLLDGLLDGPLELGLADEREGTTGWLVRHLRVDGMADAGCVVVHAVPGRRTNLGLLVTVPRGGEGLDAVDEHDRTVLHLVVRRVGMAVENVRLYDREHRLAETLQRAMLPVQADIADLDVWTYYAPNAGHAQVGGDWYDVLQISDQVAAVVIGDVVGHDVEAAAAMGQLRSVVRSYAYEGSAPGLVLDKVDTLVTGMGIPRSASLVFATMERVGTGWTLRYSRAGHLPPLVCRGGQVTLLDSAGGAMVGFGSGGRSSASYDLLPGDVLLLYTDGLIERRDRSLRDGLSALVAASGLIGTLDAAGVGEELLSRLADSPEDDIAVVVVRIPDPSAVAAPDAPELRRRRWSLASEAASIGRARQAVLRTSAAWGITGVPASELVVSELVANAVLHGWGHVVLRLFDTGDGLRIEVEDANPAPPVTTDGHPGRVGGYGMRIVERLADWGWRPSGTGKLVWARVRPVPSGSGLTLDGTDQGPLEGSPDG
jgi:PAS domain S-box-containing protein